MLLTAHAHQEEHRDIFDQMFRLRARSFLERRGWRVEVDREGREIDAFDRKHNPLYVCLLSDDGKQLLASLRLLPTMGPHMLADVFPEVMGEAGIVRNPLVWESSRFCVDTDAAHTFGKDGIHALTRGILAGLCKTAKDAGMQNIISVYDVYVERILKRAGCTVERIGPVVRYDNGLRTVGGLFEVSDKVLQDLCEIDTRARDLIAA